MPSKDAINLVGPCGIACSLCECHTCKDNPSLLEYLVSRGISRDKLPCPGCRPLKGNCPVIAGPCVTYTCASQRSIDFCYQCEEFPCSRLNPAADRADVLPHNLKVFNLCCIQHQGLARWLEEASVIKQRYYRGKMAVGKGPQLG